MSHKFITESQIHVLGHKVGEHVLKYVQSPQFQSQVQQLGQAIVRSIR
jgi:hypothetical protein